MDVETMQKINALAKELTKHHIATSNEDAVVQAQEIFQRSGKDPGRDVVDIKETEKKEESAEMIGEKNIAVERELNNLNNTLRALNTNLMAMKEQVGKINNDMDMMRTQFNEVLALKRKLAMQEEKPVYRQEAAPAEERPVLREIREAPRSQPADPNGPGGKNVAVDKVFYFGKK